MIGIIDCGSGNLRSVQMGFARVGADARIIRTAEEAASASKLVLPGQGHFGSAVASLRRRGLDEAIVSSVESGRPLLGICLGLQLLFDVSYEDGEHAGLGLLPGKVVRFNFEHLPGSRRLAVPHMGWNQIRSDQRVRMLDGVPPDSYVYFVHSYHVVPLTESARLVRTDYGVTFVSGVERENIFAVQFHPEKSQVVGLRILANFAGA